MLSTKREQHGHELGGWRDRAGHDRGGSRSDRRRFPPGIILTVASKAGTGLFLADGSGRALYVLDKTPSDTNSWKPVSGASAPTTTDTSIKAGMIGTTSGANGMQATYGGKALYYYAGDAAAGDVKGDGKKRVGRDGASAAPRRLDGRRQAQEDVARTRYGAPIRPSGRRAVVRHGNDSR